MTAVLIVATIVHNINEDTGAAPSSGNARVIVRRRGREEMIIQGTRVSGSFGELVPNSKGPTFKRVRHQSFATVLRSVGAKKYAVVFNNGMERECASNSMKILPKTVGLPPDDLESSEINPGVSSESNGITIDEASQENIQDREYQVDTEEHIPTGEEGNTAIDNCVDDDDINIGNINVPADNIQADDDAPLTYQQKLHASRYKVTCLLDRKPVTNRRR